MNNFNQPMPGTFPPPVFGSEMMMGGPQITGKWINKATGEEVQVRDTVMCDEGVSVMLADGRMISMNEFSNNYYQISDDLYDTNGNVIGKCNEKEPVNIPPYNPGKPGMVPPPIDDDFLHHPIPPKPDCGCHKPVGPKPGPHKPCPKSDFTDITEDKKHLDMIKEVFAKVSPAPKLEASTAMQGTNFPTTQLQMLVNIFNVSIEDIAVYLYKTYFTPEQVVEYLKSYVSALGIKEPTITDDSKTDKDFGVDSSNVDSSDK